MDWTERCLDVVCDEDGCLPERFSTAELLVYLAGQLANNVCPRCRSEGIMRIGEFRDIFQCSECGQKWEHAWRIIHSPLIIGKPLQED